VNPITLVVFALSGARTAVVAALCALAVVVAFIARSDGLS
jgi:hypothetical protein